MDVVVPNPVVVEELEPELELEPEVEVELEEEPLLPLVELLTPPKPIAPELLLDELLLDELLLDELLLDEPLLDELLLVAVPTRPVVDELLLDELVVVFPVVDVLWPVVPRPAVPPPNIPIASASCEGKSTPSTRPGTSSGLSALVSTNSFWPL